MRVLGTVTNLSTECITNFLRCKPRPVTVNTQGLFHAFSSDLFNLLPQLPLETNTGILNNLTEWL